MLREEMDQILDQFGHSAILIRVDKKSKCSCVDTLSLSADKKCPVCLGTGFLHVGERVQIRTRVSSSSSDILPRVLSLTELGMAGIGNRLFYMKYDVRPKKQDLVVLCEWQEDIPIIDDYTEIFNVNNVEPFRGTSGQIEYFVVNCQSDPNESEKRLEKIVLNSRSSLYQMVLR